MDKKKMTPAKRRKIHTYIRAVIQLLFFILLPSAFTTAFSGAKYIFTQIGCGESIAMTSFLAVLIVLCLYTVVFGRFFCGYACAFGSFGDAVRAFYVWVCKKCKKKPYTLKESWRKALSFLKYIVLIVILLMCYAGVYEKLKGTSPWDVFSMLRAGNFKIGTYIAGVILLVVIVAGMAVCERFFCRFLCPMGAIFTLLPALPVTGLCRNKEDCLKGCSGCKRNCPADIDLPDRGTMEVMGDCFQCGKCMDVCPKENIRAGYVPWRGNEIWYTLIRAILLAAVLLAAGV
mgnify:CR=1 FL=1